MPKSLKAALGTRSLSLPCLVKDTSYSRWKLLQQGMSPIQMRGSTTGGSLGMVEVVAGLQVTGTGQTEKAEGCI
jgi:hypothetical protein